MGRLSNSVIWEYFDKSGAPEDKKALCRICDEEYSYLTTTGNLKIHLKKRHFDSYVECNKAQEAKQAEGIAEDGQEEVIYEYVVANSPVSSAEESATANNSYIKTPMSLKRRNSSARGTVPKKRRRFAQQAEGIAKGKHLIEELTEQKINVANLQKELIEKEMEEKNLKISLLQKEMEFKNEMYELETEEIQQRREDIQHKKQLNELAQQEMLLKIEVLKATLSNIQKNGAPVVL